MDFRPPPTKKTGKSVSCVRQLDPLDKTVSTRSAVWLLRGYSTGAGLAP